MIVTTTKKQFDTVEKESLEAHVEMCAHRHQALEKQILAVEKAVDNIVLSSRESKFFIIKSVGVATAAVSALMSGIIFLIDRIR